MPKIIGIAGGSASGKSTFSKGLEEKFPGQVVVICQDDYYYDHSQLSEKERAEINYDAPSAFDNKLLCKHLNDLKNGEAIKSPQYNYKTHNRKKRKKQIKPVPVIILDGILILEDEALYKLLDYSIFVDVPADERLMRRIIRDGNERNRTAEQTIEQYRSSVRPMHDLYVEPSKQNADIIIPNTMKNSRAADILYHFVKSIIEEQNL